MNKQSITGIGLVLVLAACGTDTPDPGTTPSGLGAMGADPSAAGSGGSGSDDAVAGPADDPAAGGANGGTSTAIAGSGGGVSEGTAPVAGIDDGPGAATGAGEPVDAGLGDPVGTSGEMGMDDVVETSPDVTVRLAQPRQEMSGFGINITWGSGLSGADATRLFDPNQGIGLNIVRIGMSDTGDQMSGNIFSDMRAAQQAGADIFIGTLWSPPARCKTNNDINDGGHLLTSCYQEWSDTIAAFPGRVRQNTGIDLYGMSPQNETDFASCGLVEPCNGNYPTTIFTGQEMADFVAIVGPKLRALNPPVRVIAPEASEWLHVWSNESACCSEPSGRPSSDPLNCGFPATNCSGFDGYDYGHALYAHPTAWDYVDILGLHQYDTQVAEPWPDDVPERKPVWQTEMSGVKWWAEQGPSSDIGNGVAVARWIHSALTVGDASAWLWWWYRAENTDDNEGLILRNGTVAKRLWTLGNYSKFIRRGYVRVEVTGDVPAGVLLSAFQGPDDTVVVVAVNEGGAAASVPITVAGGAAPASMTPWVTSASDDLAARGAVTVSDGIFAAELASQTVTTFVGR